MHLIAFRYTIIISELKKTVEPSLLSCFKLHLSGQISMYSQKLNGGSRFNCILAKITTNKLDKQQQAQLKPGGC